MWHAFINPPVEIDISAYDKAVERYVNRAKEISGVIEIFRYGGISTPGISDLDMLVIVEDTAEINPKNISALETHCTNEKGIWLHDVSIIPRSMWNDLKHLAYCSNINAQLKKIIFPSNESSEAEKFVMMYDALMDRLICIARMLCSEICNLRNTLLVLYSLKHTLNLCKQTGIPFEQHIESLLNEVHNLRTNWRQIRKPEELYYLTKLIFHAAHELAWTTAEHCWGRDSLKQRKNILHKIETDFDIKFYFSHTGVKDAFLAWRNISTRLSTYTLRKIIIPMPICAYKYYFTPHINAIKRAGNKRALRWQCGHEKASVVRKKEFVMQDNAEIEHAIYKRQIALSRHISFLQKRHYFFGTVHPIAFLPVDLRHSMLAKYKAKIKNTIREILTYVIIRKKHKI